MPKVLIRYTVRRDQVERNLELLRDFFDELDAIRPAGLRYASYQLEDEVSFVHFVETDAGPGPLPVLKAFQRYRSTIEDRCTGPVVMTELHEIGTFRLHGDCAADR